jgi:hypothetical protein
MYAKILNNSIVKYPYQWTDFDSENNNTNYGGSQPNLLELFPQTDIAKQGYLVVAVTPVTQPTIDVATQSVAEGIPMLVNGVWTQTWEVSALSTEQQAALTSDQAASVRMQRGAKLAACDWTQAVDCPLTNKATWATYRQALRDLPKETGFPWIMTWPTDPNGKT